MSTTEIPDDLFKTLKPCPFCGCLNLRFEDVYESFDGPMSLGSDGVAVACQGCGARGKYSDSENSYASDAVGSWNTRADTDADKALAGAIAGIHELADQGHIMVIIYN